MVDVPPDVMALGIGWEEMRQTPKPVIVNVVSTYDLWCPNIDAETLAMRLPGFHFNPHRFAATKMRMGRAMTLAFHGGRAVCPGARRVSDARLAAIRFTGLLLDAGELVCYHKFRVQNIVCSVWAPFEIELANIIEEYSGNAEYNKSKFPGLAFRMVKPAIVFNVFVTGRVVITGSKDFLHSQVAWYWFYHNVLVRHRMGQAARSTSSSSYKAQVQRAKDTFAADCERLAERYARRPDGRLANSPYASYLRTPISSLSRPVTPVATPRSAGGAPETNAGILFRRMEDFFHNHGIHCPFVRGTETEGAELVDEKARPYWATAKNDVDCATALADDEGSNEIFAVAERMMGAHLEAGCVGMAVLRDRYAMREKLCEYAAQLHMACEGEPIVDVEKSAARRTCIRLELEDVFDAEAQLRLDLFRAGEETREFSPEDVEPLKKRETEKK